MVGGGLDMDARFTVGCDKDRNLMVAITLTDNGDRMADIEAGHAGTVVRLEVQDAAFADMFDHVLDIAGVSAVTIDRRVVTPATVIAVEIAAWLIIIAALRHVGAEQHAKARTYGGADARGIIAEKCLRRGWRSRYV